MTTDLAIDPQLHGSLDLTDPDSEGAPASRLQPLEAVPRSGVGRSTTARWWPLREER